MNFHLPLTRYCAALVESVATGALAANVESRDTDTQAWVGGGETFGFRNVYYVVFPGTASLRDARTDAAIRKNLWNPGMVHRGFLSAFGSVSTQIVLRLPHDAEVIILGHSLGGALATLFADAVAAERRVRAVITFGSPRVGNGTFARAYNDRLADRTFRVTNAGDPIPWTPPLWLSTWLQPAGGIYTHVAREHYLNRSHGLDIEPWTITKGLEAFEAAKANHSSLITIDHPIAAYRRKLEALA